MPQIYAKGLLIAQMNSKITFSKDDSCLFDYA